MSMIYLSQLEKLINHNLVLEYYERGIESMCMNEFLPLCAALLYPYRNEKFPSDDTPKGNIMPIIESVKSFTKKIKGLEKYCLDGLRKYFQYKWLPTLDFASQKRLINGVSLIDEVADDGFFSLKGNDKVYQAYIKIPILDISHNYGELSFEIPNEEELIMECNNTTSNPENDKETVSLEPLKSFLGTSELSGLNTNNRFFWEYKLNKKQYDNLKDILIKLKLGKNTGLLRKEIVGYGTVARVVALFVSEWYKRECKTIDGDMCLEVVGLSCQNSSNIWKYASLPESFLHREDEDEDQMRQVAMCALGGLPLICVNNSGRFKEFVNGLFNIYQNNEGPTTEDLEKVIEGFIGKEKDKNKVFLRSLKSGSCKKYLDQLVKYLESERNSDLPFNESDVMESPFSDFITQLKEGYDQELPKRFFTPEIRIWTYDFMEEGDDSNRIESEFYVHIGSLKSNNVITTRDLSKLGIMLPPEANMFDARLKITLKDGSSIIKKDEKRTYHKIGNHCDDFCGAFGSSLATSIDLFKTKDIALLIECGNYCKEIHLYTIPSYLELYATDNGFLWTDKKNNAAQKVVFYDKYIYTPQNEEDLDVLTKSFKESEWGWIYMAEAINLVDSTGELITIELGESELIMVDFKVKSLRKTIEFSKDGCVECVIQDDDIKEIPLLYFDDRTRPMFACDGMRGNDLLKNYKIEFKTTSGHYYSEWTTNNVPPQGFLSIRISCRDDRKKKKPRKLDVYFIPGTYPIVKRNLDNNYIYIKGENICVLDESLRKNLKQTDDEFNYKFQDSCDNLQLSSIRFRIGDDDNHIILKVYRAFHWTRILNQEKKIKDITNDGNEKPPVALILQKNIHLQVVNEEGYKDYSPCYQGYLEYFRDPMYLSFVKQGSNLSGFYIDEASRPYRYCVYISSFDDNGKIRKIEKNKDDKGNEYFLLNVSNKDENKKEYSFYYWSGELKDDPVKLEPKDPKEKPFRFDIPSPLHQKAVVFQSLRDCSPNLYFRPFYENVRWDNYVQRYDLVNIDYIIRCYQIAVDHNVYFCIFPAIRNLQKRESFTEFICQFVQMKNYHFSEKDKENLIRLAKELAMDWFFVDRKALYNGLDEDTKHKIKKCIRGLLLHSPIARHERAYSIEFIDKWFLANNKAFGQRDGKLPRKFLKALDCFNDYDGSANTENRISLLNQLINTTDNIFQEICGILNN